MTRNEALALANQFYTDGATEREVAFARFVAAAKEAELMQLFTDPENQPTQYGTVTVDYMQHEIAAERGECLELAKSYAHNNTDLHSAIRARGQS